MAKQRSYVYIVMFNIQSGVFFHDCENDIKLLRVRLLQRAKIFWTANKLFKALYNYNFDQRSSSYPQCWSILNETNICSTEKADISFADTWEKCCVPHFDTQVWKSKKCFFLNLPNLHLPIWLLFLRTLLFTCSVSNNCGYGFAFFHKYYENRKMFWTS